MKTRGLLCGIWLFSPAPAIEACELPALPLIPEEAEDARHTRQIERDTQRYLDSMVEYVACVQSAFRAARDDGATNLHLGLLMRRNNAAVAEFEAITNLFIERIGPIENLDLRRLRAVPAGPASTRPAVSGTANELAEFLDAESLRCIPVAGLRSTTVMNDRAVLFYRRSGRVFLNALEDSCLGLQRSGSFSYEVRGGRNPILCETDLIYPTETFDGAGFPCGLGTFYEISEAQADALLNPDEPPGRNDLVNTEPVELPDDAEQSDRSAR